MMKNTCGLHRSSCISGHLHRAQPLLPFHAIWPWPFASVPALWQTAHNQCLSPSGCWQKNNQKNNQKTPKTVGPAWQGLHWQPCLPASGPPDLALVVLWDSLPHYLIQPRPAPQRPIGSDANNMNSKWLTWVRNPEMKSILHAFCMGW